MKWKYLRPSRRTIGFCVRVGLLTGIVILALAGLEVLSFTDHVSLSTSTLEGSTSTLEGSSTPAPRLELSTSRLDLGEGKPNQLLHGGLQLRNIGSEVLTFETSVSCGCTELSPRRGSIPAGGEQDIHLAVRLPDYTNSERAIQLVVRTNDSQRPDAACTIMAKCPAPFRVTPAFVEFGKISRGTTVAKPAEIHVTVTKGERRRVRARLSSAAFVLVSEQSDRVQVAPADGLEFGDYYGTLELFPEGNEEQVVRVPLRVQVPQPLSAVPSSLTLRKSSTGQFSPVYWILATDSGSAPLGRVRVVNAPPEFQIEEMSQIGGHRRRYRLTIAEGWEAPEKFELELENASTKDRCKLLLMRSLKN